MLLCQWLGLKNVRNHILSSRTTLVLPFRKSKKYYPKTLLLPPQVQRKCSVDGIINFTYHTCVVNAVTWSVGGRFTLSVRTIGEEFKSITITIIIIFYK